MSAVDFLPMGGFWLIEARAVLITPEPMPGGQRDWPSYRFPPLPLARDRSLATALALARIVAADMEVNAATWPEHCRAVALRRTLAQVDQSFVDGPDPRD
jgi:hypothetical protein